MKTKHFFWGALFITIGILILLNNFYYLNFGWDDLWKFWPLVLVLWGAIFLVKNTYFKSLIGAVSGIFLAFVIFATFKAGTDIFNNNYDWDSHEFNISQSGSGNYNSFSRDYEASIKEASFTFESGAGVFALDTSTSDLINAETNGSKYNFSVYKDSDNQSADIRLKMEGHHFRFWHKRRDNRAKIELNTNPVWDLDFKIGAASADFDLRPYKTKNVNIEMGAASLILRLGSNVDESHVKIEGGVSSIKIYVPDDAGCELNENISLSSRHITGFDRVDENTYRTSGFVDAKKKIYLRIDTGVSDVTVIRSSDWE